MRCWAAVEWSAQLSISGLLAVAAAEPAGFRLLFHHAAREPEFRAEVDRMRAAAKMSTAD